MTKVILSESLLKFRREMAEAVSDTIKASFIEGLKTFIGDEPPLAQPDLLPPPKIEVIELSFYQGNIGDLIFMATSSDFGVWNLQVVIQDEEGNVIERGEAAQFADSPDCWEYMATAAVPSGTRVSVYAAATDQLNGVGTARAVVTIS